MKTEHANKEEQKTYHLAVVNIKPGFIRAQYSPLVILYDSATCNKAIRKLFLQHYDITGTRASVFWKSEQI